MKEQNSLDMIAQVLVLVGGLNWGLVGALNFDLVQTLLGSIPYAANAVYVVVGLSSLYGFSKLL
jgi:uncharacterized membrane protein YuzA (DUF378 family)